MLNGDYTILFGGCVLWCIYFILYTFDKHNIDLESIRRLFKNIR